MGETSHELFWSHPVFAHTNPVFVSYRDQTVSIPESSCFLLDFLGDLENWIQQEAYSENPEQKEKAGRTLAQGLNFYRRLCDR